MLPISSRGLGSSHRYGAGDGHFPEYVRRLCDFQQMDFESAFDQVFCLLSIDPQKVYTSFYYRKQTKNQWARDDPAFVVVEMIFVGVASLAYAVAFQNASFWGYLWALLYGLVVDWLLVGVAVASTFSYLANKYLRQYHSHSVEQEVEWMFAFDVHANSFLCSFVLTHVLQYFLLPILLNTGALPCLMSNILYGLAVVWYAYITHLGYRTLPFLGNTQVFLWYPIVAVSFALLFSIVLMMMGLRINMTRVIMAFHYG
mmetsp:Transcript_1843/g.2924  ORF Transcript_1843/g.2924 Transcript_1843/m.2924 type:complete len:257 (+) Transcript_1843:81-851(+)